MMARRALERARGMVGRKGQRARRRIVKEKNCR